MIKIILEGLRQLRAFYYESLFGKTINKVGSKITSCWKRSIIGSWVLNDSADETISESAVYKILSIPFEHIYKFGDGAASYIRSSFVYAAAKRQIGNALTLDSRFYGTILLVFALGRFAFNRSVNLAFIAGVISVILGALLIWLNRPLISFLKHSFIYKFIEYVLGDKFEIEFLEKQQGGSQVLLGVVNGLIMLAVSAVMPLMYAPIAFAGITVMLVVLWRYEAGLYALIFIAPILPTMLCIGLAAYVFISYVINRIIHGKKLFKMDGVSFVILLFIILQLFYSLTSFSVMKSTQIWLVYLMFIAMYFVAAATVDTRRKLHWIMSLFLTSCLVVSAIGILQNFFGDNIGHAWLDEEMFEDITVRVYSTLGNPNVLGEYLILAIPVAFAMIWSCKGILARLYYTGILALSCLCLVFTQSRGCWIGIIVGIGVYIFIVNKRFISFLFAGALASPFVMPDSIVERFTSIGDTSDSSTSYRVFIWFGVVNLLKDFWLYGIGIGEQAFARIYPFYAYSNIYAPHSHNIYLQLIVEMGISGLVVMFFVMLLFWRRIIAAYAKGKTALTVSGVGILAGTVAFMCQGAFDYVWYNYRVVLIFWMLLGIGTASVRLSQQEKEMKDLD